ncbi:unnamed protein product [Bemisia tabaci]|uniref:Uncharacterized protein n=1 Tax=Bemisia tabaci TaxID=7038 RepID=A0A9P0ALW3_BEMTA|nr:unnamed protein product [Bemisia tabaci]
MCWPPSVMVQSTSTVLVNAEAPEAIQFKTHFSGPQNVATDSNEYTLHPRGLLSFFGFGGSSLFGGGGWNMGGVTHSGDTHVNIGHNSFQYDEKDFVLHSLNANEGVTIRNSKIYHGKKLIADLKEKTPEAMYQKTPDGARWFVNVKIPNGQLMTSAEIKQFNKDWAKNTGQTEAEVETWQKEKQASLKRELEKGTSQRSSWWW